MPIGTGSQRLRTVAGGGRGLAPLLRFPWAPRSGGGSGVGVAERVVMGRRVSMPSPTAPLLPSAQLIASLRLNVPSSHPSRGPRKKPSPPYCRASSLWRVQSWGQYGVCDSDRKCPVAGEFHVVNLFNHPPNTVRGYTRAGILSERGGQGGNGWDARAPRGWAEWALHDHDAVVLAEGIAARVPLPPPPPRLNLQPGTPPLYPLPHPFQAASSA